MGKELKDGKKPNKIVLFGRLLPWTVEPHYYLGILEDSVESASDSFCLRAKEMGMLICQFPSVFFWGISQG